MEGVERAARYELRHGSSRARPGAACTGATGFRSNAPRLARAMSKSDAGGTSHCVALNLHRCASARPAIRSMALVRPLSRRGFSGVVERHLFDGITDGPK